MYRAKFMWQHYSFKPVLSGKAFMWETAYICSCLMFKNRITQQFLAVCSALLSACFLGYTCTPDRFQLCCATSCKTEKLCLHWPSWHEFRTAVSQAAFVHFDDSFELISNWSTFRKALKVFNMTFNFSEHINLLENIQPFDLVSHGGPLLLLRWKTREIIYWVIKWFSTA